MRERKNISFFDDENKNEILRWLEVIKIALKSKAYSSGHCHR